MSFQAVPLLGLSLSLSLGHPLGTSSPTRNQVRGFEEPFWFRPEPNHQLKHFQSSEADVQQQYQRQHAFELGLEQMLMEVEHGWRSELRKRKEEKKEDEKASNGRGIEEMTTPGWQKVWYKRLG